MQSIANLFDAAKAQVASVWKYNKTATLIVGIGGFILGKML